MYELSERWRSYFAELEPDVRLDILDADGKADAEAALEIRLSSRALQKAPRFKNRFQDGSGTHAG